MAAKLNPGGPQIRIRVASAGMATSLKKNWRDFISLIVPERWYGENKSPSSDSQNCGLNLKKKDIYYLSILSDDSIIHLIDNLGLFARYCQQISAIIPAKETYSVSSRVLVFSYFRLVVK